MFRRLRDRRSGGCIAVQLPAARSSRAGTGDDDAGQACDWLGVMHNQFRLIHQSQRLMQWLTRDFDFTAHLDFTVGLHDWFMIDNHAFHPVPCDVRVSLFPWLLSHLNRTPCFCASLSSGRHETCSRRFCIIFKYRSYDPDLCCENPSPLHQ